MRYVHERFIGDWTNTSGGYPHTSLDGLSRRSGSGPKLYKFQTPYTDPGGCYITDPALVRQIEDRLLEVKGAETLTERDEHLEDLEALLYMEIAKEFGVMVIIEAARRSASEGYERGLDDGRRAAQKDIRKALGINR